MYAIGEIILVVIGILIALSINTWDSNQKNEEDILAYKKKIIRELENTLLQIDYDIVYHDTLIQKSRKTLEILNSRNMDSIHLLNSTLGATGISSSLYYEFPIIDQFMENGYLKRIENDSTQLYFTYLMLARSTISVLQDFGKTQYAYSIEPFIIKNINYSNVALPEFQSYLLVGGPSIDYKKLMNNLELWNVVTLKHETLSNERDLLTGFKDFTQKMKTHLENNL